MSFRDLDCHARSTLRKLMDRYPIGYEPEIVWRNLRVTAGLADFKHRRIVLSTVLLNHEERLETTLTHEYAHLLAAHRHGRRGVGHGAPWKQAMVDLGMDPKVHHDYEVCRNAARQEVAYKCSRCGGIILRRRHLPRRRRYLHVGCGGAIIHEWTRRITPDSAEA